MEKFQNPNIKHCSKICKKLGLIGTLFLFICALVPLWSQLNGPFNLNPFFNEQNQNNYFMITLDSMCLVIALALLVHSLICAYKNKCAVCLFRSFIYTFLACFYICWIAADTRLQNGEIPSANGTIGGINMYVAFAFNYLVLAITASLFGSKLISAIKHH